MKLTDEMLVVIKSLDRGSKHYTRLIGDLVEVMSISKARRAIERCKENGFVRQPKKGVYEITEIGRRAIALVEKK